VRVRGIYSTALSKLLLDKGFSLSQVSEDLAERFESDRDVSPADAEINSEDGSGIVVSGEVDAVASVKDALMETFLDIIKRDSKINLNAVYLGTVQKVDSRLKAAFVDIDDEVGYLPFSNTTRVIREDEDIKVQIRSLPMGGKKPVLDMKINLPGKYAVFLSDDGAKVSKKIKGPKRDQLIDLGRRLKPEGWGLLWRTSAEDADEEELGKDVENLKRAADEVENSLANPLYSGEEYISFEFGGEARRELDGLRATITPTVDNHHAYKSMGEAFSLAVDVAETLMEKVEAEEANAALVGAIFGNLDTYFYTVEHVKADGSITHLKGVVRELSDERITLRRRMMPGGRYDGLNVEIEEGDYALTEMTQGSWYYTNSYFSASDVPKGRLININTPLEFYPGKVRYIDLEVDVVIRPNGRTELIDETNLIDLVGEGYIDKKLYEQALSVADQAVKGELPPAGETQ
jgi:Ribonuclease G/E